MTNPFKPLNSIKTYKPKSKIVLTEEIIVINGKEIKCERIKSIENIREDKGDNMEENKIVSESIEEVIEKAHVCKCKKDKFNPQEQVDGNEVRFCSSEDTKELYKALLEFHKNFENVTKLSTNPFHMSKYADLSTILNVIRPLLAEQGLILTQFSVSGKTEHSLCIKTRLIHTDSGQFLETDSISLKPQKIDAQSFGSISSYLRRYSINSILMIGFADEDDDGNSVIVEDEPPKSTRDTSSGRTATRSTRRSL